MWRQASRICSIASSSFIRSPLFNPGPCPLNLVGTVQSRNSSGSGSSSRSGNKTGMFGISRLQQQSDFPRWAADAKDRCNDLVQHITCAPPDAAVVRMVDDISDTICQVYDTAECVRNIHPDASWRQAATAACQSLSVYLADINHHEGLYNKLREVQDAFRRSAQAAAAAGTTDHVQCQTQQQQQQQDALPQQLAGPLLSAQQLSGFCPETLVVAAKYQQDFEKFGIHLKDGQQRARIAQLLALNQHFPAQFNATLADPQRLGSVEVSSRVNTSRWWGRAGRLGGVSVPLDSGSIHHFLATTDFEDARRQVYMAGARGPVDNLALLDQMLTARHELGTVLGYQSYAAFKAADSTLAGSPDAAEAFLMSLLEGSRQQADEERAALTAIKRKHTGESASTLQPWDQDFYTRQLSSMEPHIKAAAAATPYLQLGSVLQGLSDLLHQLMGLQLELQPLLPGEAWAPGVLKLVVTCQDLGVLGVLYLDMLTRPGKPGASGILYPLRCGRELPGGDYQKPILCLVGNLSASSSNAANSPLTWREFRTLLHEMGHAVHSLVSRTRYQHVWGTRCSQDLVEVPSHLWEHFTSSPKSLTLLARHKGTRDPLPHKMATALCNRWSNFSSVTPALELQQQALLSLIDLRYHGQVMPEEGDGSTEVWQQLAQEHSSIPPPFNTQPQARFSHLTIYGACYYSYLYARSISEALWDVHLAQDPLDACAGQHLRRLLLQPGGSMEPLELLTAAFGGKQVRDRALVKQQSGWSPEPTSLLQSIRSRNPVAVPAAQGY